MWIDSVGSWFPELDTPLCGWRRPQRKRGQPEHLPRYSGIKHSFLISPTHFIFTKENSSRKRITQFCTSGGPEIKTSTTTFEGTRNKTRNGGRDTLRLLRGKPHEWVTGTTKNPLQQESTAINTALCQGNKRSVSKTPVMFKDQRHVFSLAKHGIQITRPAFISPKVNGKPMVFCWALGIRFTKRVENKDGYLFWKQQHLFSRKTASMLT